MRLSIGETSRATKLSVDTLRYYERIGLLPRVARDPGGRRRFDDADLSRLRFIRRAQTCSFSLAEIRQMLSLREASDTSRPEVQRLTEGKLAEVERRLADLDRLKRELELLLNLCHSSDAGCPIIDNLEGE